MILYSCNYITSLAEKIIPYFRLTIRIIFYFIPDKAVTTLTKISHNISYMKISYMKSLYGIETNFIYEIVSIPHKDFIYQIFHISNISYMKLFQLHIKISYIKYFIYEIFIYEIVSIPHKDFIYQIFHI